MRLLNVYNRQLEEFTGTIPRYVILSHTWTSEEVSLQDLLSATPGDEKKGLGWRKIEGLCDRAARDGYKYAWIDTCCIDKSSSAELSEAINSMYAWYGAANKCYVHLEDVCAADDPFAPGSDFRCARWHTRGWTLQELLAPAELEFHDRDWKYMFMIDRRGRSGAWWGHTAQRPRPRPEEHVRLLSEITHISEDVLRSGDTSDTCVAARLAWAARRRTTRVEDTAYCLLGLLGVHMPLLYGEGERAFVRLQQEIINMRDDNSLLAWGYDMLMSRLRDRGYESRLVLAQSPAAFSRCGDFKRLRKDHARILWGSAGPFPSTMTNVGLQIVLPILSIDPKHRVALAALSYTPHVDYVVVVPLTYSGHISKGHFRRALGSLPFLVRAELLLKTSSCKSPLVPLLTGGKSRSRTNTKAMQVLLRSYDVDDDDETTPVDLLWWRPLWRLPLRGLTLKRLPFIVDFSDVINVADCRLISFYPPSIGSMRSEANWSVHLAEDVSWCFLIFRSIRCTFGISIRPRLAESSGGVVGGFGEVNLTAAVEHLVTQRAAAKGSKTMTMAGAGAVPVSNTTVTFPRFQSPRFELDIPEMPHAKHVLSFRADDVFKNWLNITCRAEGRKGALSVGSY